jgi:hypothetical protein
MRSVSQWMLLMRSSQSVDVTNEVSQSVDVTNEVSQSVDDGQACAHSLLPVMIADLFYCERSNSRLHSL